MLLPLVLALALTELPPDVTGLPPFSSANPGSFSHSPLGFQPFAMPKGNWAFDANIEYANAIELYQAPDLYYDFDGEVLRVDLSVVRRFGARDFAQLRFGVFGAYAGFLDSAIDAYHSLLGISYPVRRHRPLNQFEYLLFDHGREVKFAPVPLAPLDPELGWGHLLGAHWQLYGALTFPGGAGDGYGRKVVTASLRATGQYRLTGWLLSESSVGIALAPRSGPLASWQRPWLLMGTTGLSIDFGSHAFYGNVMVQSAPDDEPTSPVGVLFKLDAALDFGYRHRIGEHHSFWVGLTEDLLPGGPAVDVVIHFGTSWDP